MPDATEYRIGRLDGGFCVSWWEGGKRRRYRLDAQSRKEAESEAIDVVRRETVKQKAPTVKTLWDLYRQEKSGRRVAAAMKSEWGVIGPSFGALRYDQIGVDTCRAYVREQRKAKRKDGTIWTEMGHLRTVLVWAVKRQLIPYAPEIERPQKPASKDRWLNDAEITKLLAVDCAPHIKLAIQLMLQTAGRVTAILELTWDRVDFERGQINLRSDDEGPRKGRAVVAMNPGLKASLSQAKAMALTDYCIEWGGQPVKRIKTGFKRAVKDAGLDGVSPHVLRHTAAVHMAAAGIPMERISQFLGHTSTAVTERVYARFAPDHLREAAAVLDFTTRLRLVK
jgi:integrase